MNAHRCNGPIHRDLGQAERRPRFVMTIIAHAEGVLLMATVKTTCGTNEKSHRILSVSDFAHHGFLSRKRIHDRDAIVRRTIIHVFRVESVHSSLLARRHQQAIPVRQTESPSHVKRPSSTRCVSRSAGTERDVREVLFNILSSHSALILPLSQQPQEFAGDLPQHNRVVRRQSTARAGNGLRLLHDFVRVQTVNITLVSIAFYKSSRAQSRPPRCNGCSWSRRWKRSQAAWRWA